VHFWQQAILKHKMLKFCAAQKKFGENDLVWLVNVLITDS